MGLATSGFPSAKSTTPESSPQARVDNLGGDASFFGYSNLSLGA